MEKKKEKEKEKKEKKEKKEAKEGEKELLVVSSKEDLPLETHHDHPHIILKIINNHGILFLQKKKKKEESYGT